MDENGRSTALKVVCTPPQPCRSPHGAVCEEAQLLRSLAACPHVVQLLGAWRTDEGRDVLQLEWCDTDLAQARHGARRHDEACLEAVR